MSVPLVCLAWKVTDFKVMIYLFYSLRHPVDSLIDITFMIGVYESMSVCCSTAVAHWNGYLTDSSKAAFQPNSELLTTVVEHHLVLEFLLVNLW